MNTREEIWIKGWMTAMSIVTNPDRDIQDTVASIADNCLAAFDKRFPVASMDSFRKERVLACEAPGDFLVVVPIKEAFNYPYVIPYNETLVGTRLKREDAK